MKKSHPDTIYEEVEVTGGDERQQHDQPRFSNKLVEELRQISSKRRYYDEDYEFVDMHHYNDEIYNFKGENDKSKVRCKQFDQEFRLKD